MLGNGFMDLCYVLAEAGSILISEHEFTVYCPS